MKIKSEIEANIKELTDKAIDEDGEGFDPDYILDEGEQAELSVLEWVLMTDPDIRDIGRRIVCAALQYDSGELIVGPRHFCPVMNAQLCRSDDNGIPEQGFIDQRGKFLNRTEAWIVADEAGQIIRRVGGDEKKLYSENLY